MKKKEGCEVQKDIKQELAVYFQSKGMIVSEKRQDKISKRLDKRITKAAKQLAKEIKYKYKK